ncbi:FtsW/RodA/SpoVE family cell cycle protein [Gorillibacterium sp. sgz500922]|uniref:FtsW/RodA/SpoVE family cell cycle protein n=1 Tax=Gorillibacterium sp. sgz500922 TaxID=3446694 RepID=UPI003F66A037
MTLLNKLKKLDWTIVFILALFAVIGTMMIYSATLNSSKYHSLPKKNVLFFIMGLVLMLGTSLINYRHLFKWSWWIYGIGIALLIGVYPLGKVQGGAHGWYDLKVIQLQPAELMKFILIISICAFLIKRQGEKLEFLRDVVPIGLIGGLPFVIIAIYPDLGNAVILAVLMLGLYWIGNIKLSHLLIGVSVLALLLGGFFYAFKYHHDASAKVVSDLGFQHFVKRIDTFINPDDESRSKTENYQSKNSLKAIGSGGITGDGFTEGRMVQSGSIPVVYTDTIFVVVAEEFGFVGSAALLMLYFLLLYRMIMVAMESKDRGGGYLIIGIVTLFAFQIFQNIGMLLGLMPITGITLPFISYGGSSLLVNLLGMGLVLSVRIHHDQPIDSEEAL